MIEGDGVGAPAGAPPMVGNDGLTDAVRAACAQRFRETVMAPLSPAKIDALRAWRARRELFRMGREQGATRARCTCAAWSAGECCCDYDWETR